ncbi:MAG: endonuclease [Bacteroidales bacterium]|nr:endonuclease [Bacteroidales bacterium]
MKKVITAVLLLSLCAFGLNAKKPVQKNFRLLYWNIQNGMWSDQGNNYDNFVKWVQEYDPDVCVWAEAQTIYITGTATKCAVEDRYLVENWAELAARYGHSYVFVGGHRDNYPQVITSKYPIEGVDRIIGNVGNHPEDQRDTIVSHGAGWATVKVKGKTVNIVTLHTWPQAYSFYAGTDEAKRAQSKAEHGGDYFRATEMEYILNHTIRTHKKGPKELWMMMGDFNSRSRVDNYQYKWPEDASGFACQDVIINDGRYVDVIAERYPGEFKTSTGGQARIDYVYTTRPLYKKIVDAYIVKDEWAGDPVRDPSKLSNFYHPSDHRPILVDFKF